MNAFGFSVKGEHEDDSVDSENDDDDDDAGDDRCVADSMTKVPVDDVTLIAFAMIRFALAASEKHQVRELGDRTCTNRSGPTRRFL